MKASVFASSATLSLGIRPATISQNTQVSFRAVVWLTRSAYRWCAQPDSDRINAMSHLRHAAAVALALASIAFLSGCVAEQSAFTDLRSDREAHDELPQLADYAYGEVDVSTSRFVGEHDGTSVWLAEGLDGYRVCIVADAGDDGWIVGCGGGTTKISGLAGTFEVVPDHAPAPEGATQLSENVYAW